MFLNFNKNLVKVLLIVTLIFCSFQATSYVKAASLSLNASAKNLKVGSTVRVSVYVDAQGQPINSAEGAISFPTDLLQVMSIEKSGSVISFWINEPSFSNTSGRVSFVGGLPNPGYSGSGGKIISINFKAKKSGKASIYYSSGSVRANDGMGTNVLQHSYSTSLQISESVDEPESAIEKKQEASVPKTVKNVLRVINNDFEIKELERNDLTDPQVKFEFLPKDKYSEIEYFEIQIDTRNLEILKFSKNNQYIAPILELGEHSMIVKAFDTHNKYKVNSVSFVIKPLDAPIITFYQKNLLTSDILAIKGITYANSQVLLHMQNPFGDIKQVTIQSNEAGAWNYVSNDSLFEGTYILWSSVIDLRGAKSLDSQKTSLYVTNPKSNKIENGWTSLQLTLLILIILLLIFSVWYEWRKYSVLKKQSTLEHLNENIKKRFRK